MFLIYLTSTSLPPTLPCLLSHLAIHKHLLPVPTPKGRKILSKSNLAISPLNRAVALLFFTRKMVPP